MKNPIIILVISILMIVQSSGCIFDYETKNVNVVSQIDGVIEGGALQYLLIINNDFRRSSEPGEPDASYDNNKAQGWLYTGYKRMDGIGFSMSYLVPRDWCKNPKLVPSQNGTRYAIWQEGNDLMISERNSTNSSEPFRLASMFVSDLINVDVDSQGVVYIVGEAGLVRYFPDGTISINKTNRLFDIYIDEQDGVHLIGAGDQRKDGIDLRYYYISNGTTTTYEITPDVKGDSFPVQHTKLVVRPNGEKVVLFPASSNKAKKPHGTNYIIRFDQYGNTTEEIVTTNGKSKSGRYFLTTLEIFNDTIYGYASGFEKNTKKTHHIFISKNGGLFELEPSDVPVPIFGQDNGGQVHKIGVETKFKGSQKPFWPMSAIKIGKMA